jgi:hypothetical protein
MPKADPRMRLWVSTIAVSIGSPAGQRAESPLQSHLVELAVQLGLAVFRLDVGVAAGSV